MDVFNKFTGNLARTYETSDRTSINGIVRQSREAFRSMGTLNELDRSRALQMILNMIEEEEDSLSSLITEETGKPKILASNEVTAAKNIMEAAIQALGTDSCGPMNYSLPGKAGSYSLYRNFARGTVAGTCDYGNPLLSAALKIAASIATENTLLIFPSRIAPTPSLKLISFIEKTPLPEHAVQPILTEESGILDEILALTDETQGNWELVFDDNEFHEFTMLENFEKRPENRYAIIWNDADLDTTAESISKALFLATRGSYIRSIRIIVHRDVSEYIVNRFIEILSSMKVGDPSDPDTSIGPIAGAAIVSMTSDILEEEIRSGSYPILDLNIRSPFIYPVLLDCTGNNGPLSVKGVFGPVMSIYRVDSLQEIVDMCNVNASGTDASLYTSDINIAKSMFERVGFSSLNINMEPAANTGHFRSMFMDEMNSHIYTKRSLLNL